MAVAYTHLGALPSPAAQAYRPWSRRFRGSSRGEAGPAAPLAGVCSPLLLASSSSSWPPTAHRLALLGAGWELAGSWLGAGWELAGSWLGAGWELAGSRPPHGGHTPGGGGSAPPACQRKRTE